VNTKVVTQNCSPAPSQSEAVIIGLETHTNPFSWKNLCVAYANAFLTLATWNHFTPSKSKENNSENKNKIIFKENSNRMLRIRNGNQKKEIMDLSTNWKWTEHGGNSLSRVTPSTIEPLLYFPKQKHQNPHLPFPFPHFLFESVLTSLSSFYSTLLT